MEASGLHAECSTDVCIVSKPEPDWMICGECGATRNWYDGLCVGDDGINPVGICDASIKDAAPAYQDPQSSPMAAEAVQEAIDLVEKLRSMAADAPYRGFAFESAGPLNDLHNLLTRTLKKNLNE